jgi:hypothetical protein
MKGKSGQSPAAAEGSPVNPTPVPLLEAIRKDGKTWEELAPRYGVTHPDPPWKVAFTATCECLAVSGAVPWLQLRRAEDHLAETLYNGMPVPEQQLLALAHTLLSRGVVSEEELARRMQAVRSRLEDGRTEP